MVSVAPNTFFFYQPKDDPHFSYLPAKKPSAAGSSMDYSQRLRTTKITPEPMLTTGASVPRQLWYVPGFAPFDFTRAALIHDWLYEAHHRYSIGEDLAKHGATPAAQERGRQLMTKYGAYAEVTQDDAADLFAECIKAIMEQSHSIQTDLKNLRAKEVAKGRQTVARIDDLIKAYNISKKSRFHLGTYHYTVSSKCIVPTAKKMWDALHDDVALYEAIADSGHAEKMGYISPWLGRRFKEIYKEKLQDRAAAEQIGTSYAQSAQATDKTLRPRVYLEVGDSASQRAVMSRKSDLPDFDLKPASFSKSNPGTLIITYYRSEDKAEAAALLSSIQRLLPSESSNLGRIQQEDAGGLFRPRHYDLRMSSDLSRLLQP